MKRDIYNRLKEWKLSERRKPLIMYGARQVGKTYIIKEFGSHEFDNMVYVNCCKNETIAQLFQGDVNIDRILIGLSAFTKQAIVPGKTLVFLDEIQEIPLVLSSLKYFCENKPELHLIVAGSLLGVMNMRGESFPVGKVDIMHLYPMTYKEYLLANDEAQLADILKLNDKILIDSLAPKYIDYLRQYYFVGGMPEAVLHFTQHHDPMAVRNIQQNILSPERHPLLHARLPRPRMDGERASVCCKGVCQWRLGRVKVDTPASSLLLQRRFFKTSSLI